MAEHLVAGRRAEALGRRFLEQRGLRLVTSNYRCRAGELDLVMRDGGILTVVEIRYRYRAALIPPAATVTWRKQQRIVRATRHYLLRHHQLASLPLRFDVVAVVGDLDAPGIEWLRGAFRLDDRRR